MGVDMKEYTKIKTTEFTEWLESTYPGAGGKNRRNSFLKYLDTVAQLADSLDDMISTEGFQRIKDYDTEHNTRGWHSVSLRNWEMFRKETSGETPLGTQRDVVAARDNKRKANKIAKEQAKDAKKDKTKTKSTAKDPVAKKPKPDSGAKKKPAGKAARAQAKTVWGTATTGDIQEVKSKHTHWGTWESEDAPTVDDCERVPLYHLPSKNLYYKGKVFTQQLWQKALPDK